MHKLLLPWRLAVEGVRDNRLAAAVSIVGWERFQSRQVWRAPFAVCRANGCSHPLSVANSQPCTSLHARVLHYVTVCDWSHVLPHKTALCSVATLDDARFAQDAPCLPQARLRGAAPLTGCTTTAA